MERTRARGGAVTTGAGRSSSEIREDIGATRAELGATVETLRRRLTPRGLVEEGRRRLLASRAGEALERALEIASERPLATVATGLVLGWLALRGLARSIHRAGDRSG